MVTSHSLSTAREKLQDTSVPMVLRASYYLRISCVALDSSSIRYSSLMNALFSQNSEWVTTCNVSVAGYLQSSDPSIEMLLKPIQDLHLADQYAAVPLPMAA